jgi:hypothetical protein
MTAPEELGPLGIDPDDSVGPRCDDRRHHSVQNGEGTTARGPCLGIDVRCRASRGRGQQRTLSFFSSVPHGPETLPNP